MFSLYMANRNLFCCHQQHIGPFLVRGGQVLHLASIGRVQIVAAVILPLLYVNRFAGCT